MGSRFRRFRAVAGLDLAEAGRRPLFWFWAALMAGNAWLMSRGNWIYRSVDTSLGSPRAWVSSEFQTAFVLPLLGFLLVVFFVAVVAGMPLLRDAERRVGELLGATPLTPGEYVWGKFSGALLACLAVLAVFLAALVLFVHGLPEAARPEVYGPFHPLAYLRPALLLLVPGLVFIAGASFLLGAASGRPTLVFLLPVVLLPFLQDFVWRWFPPGLHPAAGAALRLLDPSGFRWLKETWLRVDRGISFYNTQPIRYDAPFVASRVAFVLAGLLLVDLARRIFARRRGGFERSAPSGGRIAGALRSVFGARAAARAAARQGQVAAGAPLSALAMRSRSPGLLAGTLAVARFELAEVVSQPGLYIFLPGLALFLVIDYDVREPNFDAALLLTPGTAAVRGLFGLTLWLCPLLLFYLVESLQRERSTRLASIVYAAPVATPSLLAGKVLANAAVVAASLAVAFATAAAIILSQGRMGVSPGPFLLVWGLLLLPTLLLWTAFVTAVYALTDNRYLTYGIGLLAMVATAALYLRGWMNWVGNWPLIDAVRWSDLGTFEIDRRALWLNRLLALSLVPLLAFLAVRAFRRRESDRAAGRSAGRRRRTLQLAALAAPPLVLGLALYLAVEEGFQGGAAFHRHQEYWRQNLTTWLQAPQPYVRHVELDVDLEPAERAFRVNGFYDLDNPKPYEIPWFAVTGGIGWQDLAWTLDGKPYRPLEREERTGLFLFPLPTAPGAGHRLGFRYHAVLLPGISRNGGELALGQFILPSGVIVNGRNPDFLPVIGFRPDIGVDEHNRFEPRRFPPDFWQGELDAGLDRSAFTSRMRITAPAEYTVTSTGALTAETRSGGRKTWVWESDYPLRVLNIAAGRWAVKRGHGTAVYYYPGHPYNVDDILGTLDGARRWYAEWFGPYPWRELRLNEFPAIAVYGQGNATNIFFSEAVGFLGAPGALPDLPFTVTAHEAAHQWWGHILAPGEGPGGLILAEGAANFSTLLLLDQMRGPAERIAFATQREAFYGEFRQPSDEKSLAETTGQRPGDETVTYDKGCWAFWMLLEQMGRPAYFAGARHFIARYHRAPGHPVLQHFVAAMRPFAADPQGFDAVANQWFFQVVMPEYHLAEARKRRLANVASGWEVTARIGNAGTGRMAVEVAATSLGERFKDDGTPLAGYRDARTAVVLGPGEEKAIRILCPFEPRRLIVDPDAKVLQLQRKAAQERL
ncbi:MAG TPA: hypothetical protein VOA87_03385 [Thermoanaerobaculia bacterium]|nr:hypothetical protein [Thermoanaerobaculia bacterium]